jgi:predicted secreted protein
MSEPSLESISDYDTLKGQKRKVVRAVILAGIILGIVYVLVDYKYGSVDDSIVIQDSIKDVPLR